MKPENERTPYRVWADGTTQEANQTPYVWMSDDFVEVFAASPEEAAAQVLAPAKPAQAHHQQRLLEAASRDATGGPDVDTSAEDALWHEYAGKAMQGFLARDEIFVDMRADLDAFATGAADMADAMLTEARKRGRV